MNSFDSKWQDNNKYFMMLSLMGKLSNLFSESNVPFIHYRVTENLFCKYFGADNLSRTDTAYDAKIGTLGVGIKTFTFKTGVSTEKIAEFNSLSSHLSKFSGINLARELGKCRNERMLVANNLYNIDEATYHIIGRKEHALEIFNTPYEFVDVDAIRLLSDNEKSLHFTDGVNVYNFNRSKSVLMKRFERPEVFTEIPVEILEDPYQLLESLFCRDLKDLTIKPDSRGCVILPLYSTRSKDKEVPEKSGLNQWNAGGRARHEDEVYIPVPKEIHNNMPNFFPERHVEFTLRLPDGEILSAKMCQSDSKGLMSNPNRALGHWILRKVLRLKPDTLVTKEHLDKAGFDSLIVYKNTTLDYSIDVCYSSNYSEFQSLINPNL